MVPDSEASELHRHRRGQLGGPRAAASGACASPSPPPPAASLSLGSLLRLKGAAMAPHVAPRRGKCPGFSSTRAGPCYLLLLLSRLDRELHSCRGSGRAFTTPAPQLHLPGSATHGPYPRPCASQRLTSDGGSLPGHSFVFRPSLCAAGEAQRGQGFLSGFIHYCILNVLIRTRQGVGTSKINEWIYQPMSTR